MAAPNMDQFEAYFQKADLDRDGRISGAEAVAFFRASNLPQPVLAQIWTYADHNKAGYLGREEFYNALKLVTVAQSKRDLTPAIVAAALRGPTSAKIPAPQINLNALAGPQSNVRAVSPNQPGLPSQPNQLMRPPRPPSTNTPLPPQQVFPNHGMPRAAPPQPRLPTPTPSSQSPSPKPNGSNELALTENGFVSNSSFGDKTSVTPSRPEQDSLVQKSYPSNSNVLSAIVPVSGGPQTAVKPGAVNPSQGLPTQHQQSQLKLNPNQHMQTPNAISVGAGNSQPLQSQLPWSKITKSDIEKYSKVFFQVDTDRDGKITGEQARNLFLSWRLSREILKQVWDLSDQDNDSMLSLREFCIALYLMERSREGHPLPSVLPTGVLDETLLPSSGPPATPYRNAPWKQPGVQAPQVTKGKPPRPRQLEEPTPPTQPKPKVPVLEKNLMEQLSTEEQNALNSKFQEASNAEKKVAELEKDITDAREKVEFYHAKMQELILYRSRCDNRLNEVTARISSDKREADLLAKKYEEKYKQVGDVASKLTIEEATFRDIQEKKMELYRSILKLDQEGSADTFQEQANSIQLDLEAQVKELNERCKTYGLRGKPTSLVELPFGWQLGIQEAAADWDEDWDKFDDEGLTFVKELTLDVQNVTAPPKPKTSIRDKTSSTYDNKTKESSYTDGVKAEEISNVEKRIPEDEVTDVEGGGPEKMVPGDGVTDTQGEEQRAGSPHDSPATSNAVESSAKVFQDSLSRKDVNFDGSPHKTQSENHGSKDLSSGNKAFDEPGWGTFDTQINKDSLWDFDSSSTKEEHHGKQGENSLFGPDEWGLNPIKTGTTRDNTYQKQNTFFDSVPSTPNTYAKQGPSFDSVPSTPNTYAKPSLFFDSVPSSPSTYAKPSPFFDSVPSTPNTYVKPSSFFDSVPSTPNTYVKPSSFFDSVPSTPNTYVKPSSFFDSVPSTANTYVKPSPFFDSVPSTPMFNSGNSPRGFDEGSQEHSFDAFSRFDSFNLHDSGPFGQGEKLSSFDSMHSTRDSDYDQGSFSTRDSLARFDSFRSTADSEYNHGLFPPRDSFSRFDSFRSTADKEYNQGNFPPQDSLARFDSFRSTRDSDYEDPFGSSDPFRTSHDTFGSGEPFKTSHGDQTPRKDSDSRSWKAF